MLNINKKNKYLAFVLLVGGKSTRFGSDKGVYPFRGKSLISHELDTLFNFNTKIFLVAHDKQQAELYISNLDYSNSVSFIFDDIEILQNKEIRTPLLGLYSAFKKLNSIGYNKCFALSCDMPFIKKEVIELMINESISDDCVVPRWNNGYLEPLFSIYPVKKGLEQAYKNIQKNKYKLKYLINNSWKINYISIEQKIKSVDNNLSSFININEKKHLFDLKYTQ